MHRTLRVFVTIAATLAAGQVLASAPRHPTSARQLFRHQLNMCMTRYMTRSQSISYNDANKLCKDRLQLPVTTLAFTGAEKSTIGASP